MPMIDETHSPKREAADANFVAGDAKVAAGAWGGQRKISLPSGETRTFLEDGDEITLSGHAERAGFGRIGLGDCTSRVVKAR